MITQDFESWDTGSNPVKAYIKSLYSNKKIQNTNLTTLVQFQRRSKPSLVVEKIIKKTEFAFMAQLDSAYDF